MDTKLFEEFVHQTSLHLKQLRTEAAKYRHQRNDARAELEALKAELGR